MTTAVREFWEYPDFWPLVLVLLVVAAAATVCICFGPEPGAEQPEEPTNPEGNPS